MEQQTEASYQVHFAKGVSREIRKLMKEGQPKAAHQVLTALSEAGTFGEITSLPRTKHGESRLPNVEKYDLAGGHRLVVQLADGVKKIRVFLFVGTHDEAERWLKLHRDYRWTRRATDGVLDFVRVSVPGSPPPPPQDRFSFDAPDDVPQPPLLSRLSADDWKRLDLLATARELVSAVTSDVFLEQGNEIFERLEALVSYETAAPIIDLMCHANAQEWAEFDQRLALLHGDATIVSEAEAAQAMKAPENRETFITFDDTDLVATVLKHGTLAEWMLFLHKEQKQVVDRELRGPARLRGVSGSGKTCVLVHRARALAKKYKQPVLLVTLTESMRKLLDLLADDLCGVERQLISVRTMSAFTKEFLTEAAGWHGNRAHERAIATANTKAEAAVRTHPDFAQSTFRSMDPARLASLVRSEIPYTRGRLRPQDLDLYLDSKTFQRHGRGLPLGQLDRRILLSGIKEYAATLAHEDAYDHESLISAGLDYVQSAGHTAGFFRCILSDEVQDLAELDLLLLGSMKTPRGGLISKEADGLFLAGDGAQSIYKRGFVLSRIGIDIVGRSFNLKKNYRNTHEILKAAFGLVSEFEFADVDEENVAKPSQPDFAQRHGSPPLMIRCATHDEEVEFVANDVEASLAHGQSAGQICVIAPNDALRQSVANALTARNITTRLLREDVDYESEHVKISTIESAKGHEFSVVYITGLVEGVLPPRGTQSFEVPREASRLYVAMTRARDKLVLTYSLRQGQHPSRFLMAIQADCAEGHIRNGELRRVGQ